MRLTGSAVNFIDPLGLWRWGDPLPQWLVDGSAGFGDAISFGATDWVRERMGTNGVVDKCSGAYAVGEIAGSMVGPNKGRAGAGVAARVSGGSGRSAASGAGRSARTPVGRSGQQNNFPNPNAPAPRNPPETINGREYSGHAIDRMQERGLTPSVVDNAIQNGVRGAGNRPNTSVHTDNVNNLRVVTNSENGRVVTVIPGGG